SVLYKPPTLGVLSETSQKTLAGSQGLPPFVASDPRHGGFSTQESWYSRSPSPYKGRSKSRSRSRGLSHSRSQSPRPRNHARSRSRSHDRNVTANHGNTLYVTGLSSRIMERDLEDHFSMEGKVVGCHLVVEPRTRASRGFAFVTMDTTEDADRCIKYLNQSILEGRCITVEKHKLCRSLSVYDDVLYSGEGKFEDIPRLVLFLFSQGGDAHEHLLLESTLAWSAHETVSSLPPLPIHITDMPTIYGRFAHELPPVQVIEAIMEDTMEATAAMTMVAAVAVAIADLQDALLTGVGAVITPHGGHRMVVGPEENDPGHLIMHTEAQRGLPAMGVAQMATVGRFLVIYPPLPSNQIVNWWLCSYCVSDMGLGTLVCFASL
ncbi:hypothetical protein MUK42_31063, partial [Musa troglodytarum]